MSMPFMSLDPIKSEFVIRDWEDKEHRFPGTIPGALALHEFCSVHCAEAQMSSDYNHPDDYPMFAEHAIDVAAGYFAGAEEAGLIKMIDNENAEEAEPGETLENDHRKPYCHLSIDAETTEFILSNEHEEELRFPGTVNGAADLTAIVANEFQGCTSSSDFSHPDEFPKFEKFAIDIVAGDLQEAIDAGVIKIVE